MATCSVLFEFEKKYFKDFFSLDGPTKSINDTYESSGDHENVYGTLFSYSEVHDMNGTVYGECERRAVHIRERNYHKPWYSSKNPMIFSNLKTKISSKISKEDLLKAKNSIEYTKAVNSEYG